jgi:arginase
MEPRKIGVIDAPTNLGLRPPAPGKEPGVKNLSAALRKAGFVERLGAEEAGRVEPSPYSPDPDPQTGFRNGPAVRDFTEALAARIGRLLSGDRFTVVLGGDCSVLLGAGLALKKHGRYGLAFIDAHDDFSYARDRKKYHGFFVAAGLDLALATGHGPPELTNIGGHSPYFREADIVQIGLSPTEEDQRYFAVETFEESAITAMPVDDIKRNGARAIGTAAREKLEAMKTDGFWIHLDADVLDGKIMPAADSPSEHGLTYDELSEILSELLASPKAVGLEITIFDPDLDPTGKYAREFSSTIERAFTQSGRIGPN